MISNQKHDKLIAEHDPLRFRKPSERFRNAVKTGRYTATTKAVGLVLADDMAKYLNHGQPCFPSHERLAWISGASSRTIDRAILAFEADGILGVERTIGRPNLYTLGPTLNHRHGDGGSEQPTTVTVPTTTVTVTGDHRHGDALVLRTEPTGPTGQVEETGTEVADLPLGSAAPQARPDAVEEVHPYSEDLPAAVQLTAGPEPTGEPITVAGLTVEEILTAIREDRIEYANHDDSWRLVSDKRGVGLGRKLFACGDLPPGVAALLEQTHREHLGLPPVELQPKHDDTPPALEPERGPVA